MNVLFLTEQGEGIGYGHIHRCTALADGFEELGCDITFISRGSSGNGNLVRNFHYIHEEWIRHEFLEKTLPNFDITVVDSYQVPDSTLKYIGENAEIPVYLIDSTLKFYPSGIVLFPAIYAGRYNFKRYKDLRVISGIEYLLFTKELWNQKSSNIRESIYEVGVSVGGIADRSVINIVNTIQEYMPKVEKISVFGYVDEDINEQINIDKKCEFNGYLHKNEYVSKLNKIDAMICNGGQTLHECLLLGIPTISLICADNQSKNARTWEEMGVTITFDVRNKLLNQELIKKLKELNSFTWRTEANKLCSDLVDHKGSIRSAQKILQLPK